MFKAAIIATLFIISLFFSGCSEPKTETEPKWVAHSANCEVETEGVRISTYALKLPQHRLCICVSSEAEIAFLTAEIVAPRTL